MIMDVLLCCVIGWLTTIGLPWWMASVFIVCAVLDGALRLTFTLLKIMDKIK